MGIANFILYYRIHDDYELFKKQGSFKSSDFADIVIFLNNLVFHLLWEEKGLALFSHCHSLLLVLYNRDCKRHFCEEEHWRIKYV